MRFILSLAALLSCLSFTAHAEAPPGNIYPVAPFSTAQHFTTVPCGKPFECNSHVRDDDYLKAANTCAQQRLGFPANMMTLFQKDGPYKNCALPETFAPKGPGLGAVAQWPICCLEEKDDGLCTFTCHYYISGTTK